MDPLHCTQCGERQPPGARFCPKCGAAIEVAPTVDPMVGKIVAERYLLTEKLGQGASGTIYRAEHTTLKRKLAVKILHAELSRDDAAVERFRREATTVGQIDNDHILQVLDFGRTADHRLFFAMELLEGETLQALIAREQRLAPARTIKILAQIVEALAEAHALGYIHRDLRPRNVFLSVRRGERDFVKLLDFGLAKLVRPETDMRQTAMGMSFGDPHYMSPEQARGDVIDRRTDVFAVGVVAFEMLTGETPFRGSGPFDVLQKVLDARPPSVTTLRADCPPWLNAVVMKALQKQPELRFSDLLVLGDCLRSESAPVAEGDDPNELVDTLRTVVATPVLPPAERASVIPAPGVPAPKLEQPIAAAPVAQPAAPVAQPAAPVASRTLIMQTALPASLSAAAATAPGQGFASADAEDLTTPSAPPLMREAFVAAGTADTVSGELRMLTRQTPVPKGPPTATIVVDESIPTQAYEALGSGPLGDKAPITEVDGTALHGEPTGPHRSTGDDGWFRDRALADGEEEFEPPRKKTRAPILIGAIAGAISLAGIGLIAFWPREHKPVKTEVAPPPTPTPTVTPLPVPSSAPAEPATEKPAEKIVDAPVAPNPPVAAAPVEPRPAAPVEPKPAAPAPVEPKPAAPAPVEPKPIAVAQKPVEKPIKSDTKVHADASRTSGKPTEPVAATKPTREPAAPKGFKDPFAPGANSAGQADGFVKTGRQKLAAGDFAQAQTAFNKAREIDPKNADAYAGLGEVSFELGDYNGATVQLKQALRLSPNRARFLVLLGQSYYKLGRAKDAVTEYKRALKVDPSNQEAQRSLELAEKKLSQGG